MIMDRRTDATKRIHYSPIFVGGGIIKESVLPVCDKPFALVIYERSHFKHKHFQVLIKLRTQKMQRIALSILLAVKLTINHFG